MAALSATESVASSLDNVDLSEYSVVSIHGANEARCGYCRSSRTGSFGVWSDRLTVEDYQSMLDSGWRRSGKYLYRPDLRTTCCPAYVIRLRAANYIPSSSHKRVLKRLRHTTAPAAHSTLPIRSGAKRKIAERGISRTSARDRAHEVTPMDSSTSVGASCERQTAIISVIKSLMMDMLMQLATHSASESHVENEIRNQVCINPDSVADLASSIFVRSCPAKRKGIACAGASGDHVPALSSEYFEYGTNIAMIVALWERQRRNGSLEVSEKEPKPSKQAAVRRQMQIARDLVEGIKRSSAMSWIDSVVCAHPGWINLNLMKDGDVRWNSRDSSREGICLEMAKQGIVPAQRATAENGIGSASRNIIDGYNQTSPVGTLRNGIEETSPCIQNEILGKSELSARTSCDCLDNHVASCAGADYRDDEQSCSSSAESFASDTAEEGDFETIYSSCVATQKVDLRPSMSGRTFSMHFAPSVFEEDEYQLYCRYQTVVHGSSPRECRKSSYKRFLVDSPLVSQRRPNGPPDGYGSFHIRYMLDNRLFAVGVVDVLPRSLSSVYLFYDPSYASLSPGVLSAMKEIEWVQRICVTVPNLSYYYMGFYIHSCPKMRYKAAFKPSEILCEETRHWIPAELAMAALNSVERPARTVRLAPCDIPAAPAVAHHDIDDDDLNVLIDNSLVILSAKVMNLATVEQWLRPRYPESSRQLRKAFGAFIKLVGRELCDHFLHNL